jgi:predicted nucleic acid-binding protein
VILVDTSVWIDHFRGDEPGLRVLLDGGRVLIHPFVIGELACGNLRNRSEIITLLRDLPVAPVAADETVWFYIDQHNLAGRGIGYIDAHLLVSVSLSNRARLWTREKRLRSVAGDLDILFRDH